MVRAFLEGRKTQTRRTLKIQPRGHHWEFLQSYQLRCRLLGTGNGLCARFSHHIKENPLEDCVQWVRCPYGQPGDRLWVRETWRDVNLEGAPGIAYRANDDLRDLMKERQFLCPDGSMNYDDPRIKAYDWCVWAYDVGNGEDGCGWRSSIHMPRWASRILLEIVSVRVERLQDISEADAIAEGCDDAFLVRERFQPPHSKAYRYLWEDINGNGSWDANPWVWVVEFKRVEA